MAFALILAPPLMAIALRGTPRSGGIRLFLWIAFAFMVSTLTVMFGVGGLIRRSNVGAWQRVNALAMFPWIGIAAWWLRRMTSPKRAGVTTQEAARG